MSAGAPQFYEKYIMYITKLYKLYNNIIADFELRFLRQFRKNLI